MQSIAHADIQRTELTKQKEGLEKMAIQDPYPYKVINMRGVKILQAAPGCEYSPETELYILLANNRIINNGVEITIKDVEAKINDPEIIAAIREYNDMLG